MRKTAQAGLEYLMTYGWALVLITTIVGVLILVLSPPSADEMRCSVDKPNKFILKGFRLPYDETVSASGVWVESWGYVHTLPSTVSGEILLQNITGGAITIKDINFYGTENPLIVRECTIDPIGPDRYISMHTPDGQKVSAFAIYAFNGVDFETIGCTNLSLDVSAGGNLAFEKVGFIIYNVDTVTPISLDFWNQAKNNPVTFTITYDDAAGLEQDVTVSCFDFPPTG